MSFDQCEGDTKESLRLRVQEQQRHIADLQAVISARNEKISWLLEQLRVEIERSASDACNQRNHEAE